MDVFLLSGASVRVNPSDTLAEAKAKVAHTIGVYPEALQIRCGDQILHGLQSSEICLSSLNVDQERLSCIVDANRLELAKHLRMMEPELTACRKQLVQNEKLRTEVEGQVSLEEERILVPRLPQLERLEMMQSDLYRETERLSTLRSHLHQKIFQARCDLQAALEDTEDELLAEFDDLARACESMAYIVDADGQFLAAYLPWLGPLP